MDGGAVDSLKIQGIKLEVVLMDTNSQLLKIIIVNIHQMQLQNT